MKNEIECRLDFGSEEIDLLLYILYCATVSRTVIVNVTITITVAGFLFCIPLLPSEF